MPAGAGLRIARPSGSSSRITPSLSQDPDVVNFIAAVEAADGMPLETAVRDAVAAFVAGCKADGILNALKACCILAGARTVAGALVPLVGAAPINVGPFDAGDYNRKTGLAGNAVNKRLETRYVTPQANQNNTHYSWFTSTDASGAVSRGYIGNSTSGTQSSAYRTTSPSLAVGVNSSAPSTVTLATGFVGCSRSNATTFDLRRAATTTAITGASLSPSTLSFSVFSLANGVFPSNARIAFYSIGDALDLSLLDARVTTLINAIAAAIP